MAWCWTLHYILNNAGLYDIPYSKETARVMGRAHIGFRKIGQAPFSISDIINATWNVFVNTRPNDGRKYMGILGVLWTIIVELDCSIYLYFFAYATSFLKPALKPLAYIVVIWASAYTRNVVSLFFVGLAISELSNSGLFVWVNSRKRWSIPIKAGLVLYICTVIYMREIIEVLNKFYYAHSSVPSPGSRFSFFDSRVEKWGRPAAGDSSITLAILLLFEVSISAQSLFSHAFFTLLGKGSFGLYLIHTCKLSVSSNVVIIWSVGFNIRDWVVSLPLVHDVAFKRFILFYGAVVFITIPFVVLFYFTADKLGVYMGRRANAARDGLLDKLEQDPKVLFAFCFGIFKQLPGRTPKVFQGKMRVVIAIAMILAVTCTILKLWER